MQSDFFCFSLHQVKIGTQNRVGMYGLFVIFLFYFIGNLISSLTGGIIPGSVIGMVLLFLSLFSGLVKPDKVRPVAKTITKHMAIYFVPVGVGIMVSIHYIDELWPVIVLATVASTVLVLVCTGWTFQIMERWKR